MFRKSKDNKPRDGWFTRYQLLTLTLGTDEQFLLDIGLWSKGYRRDKAIQTISVYDYISHFNLTILRFEVIIRISLGTMHFPWSRNKKYRRLREEYITGACPEKHFFFWIDTAYKKAGGKPEDKRYLRKLKREYEKTKGDMS